MLRVFTVVLSFALALVLACWAGLALLTRVTSAVGPAAEVLAEDERGRELNRQLRRHAADVVQRLERAFGHLDHDQWPEDRLVQYRWAQAASRP
jgi:hypothetical protein